MRRAVYLILLISLIIGPGCKKERKEAVKKVMVTRKIEKKPEVKLEKKIEEKEEYHYNPQGKRDPFKPFIVIEPRKPRVKRVKVPLTPLQKYDLSELKLTAIIIGMGEPRAMVEDNFGKGYILKVGDYIGKNGGRVIKIEKDRVVIRESYINYLGEEETKDITLFLHRPEEGEGS